MNRAHNTVSELLRDLSVDISNMNPKASTAGIAAHVEVLSNDFRELYISVSQWTPASITPKPDRKVIAVMVNHAGMSRRIMAEYIPKFGREAIEAELEMPCDYSEEQDAFFWPEGWYERIESWDDFSYVPVDGDVTYWVDCPELPDLP